MSRPARPEPGLVEVRLSGAAGLEILYRPGARANRCDQPGQGHDHYGRGERLLAEVEQAVAGHPAVAEVAVIGVPDDHWGETVKAMVVLRPGQQATRQEIIGFTRERLAHYKCPRTVDIIDALPRNPSGKVLKRALRAPYWEGRDRQI